MRERFERFMAGRNGTDAMGRLFLVAAMLLLIVSWRAKSFVWYAIAIAVLFYAYFRMLSRNVAKRQQENQAFLQMTSDIRRALTGWRNKAAYNGSKMRYDHEQRKVYRIFTCPGCGQKLRVPKGRGKVQVTCSKCYKSFMKRT